MKTEIPTAILVTLLAGIASAQPAGRSVPQATPAADNATTASTTSQSRAAGQRLTLEVVSADQSGMTITLKQPASFTTNTNDPPDTSIITLPVQGGAQSSLPSVRNGDQVSITCGSTSVATGASGTTGATRPAGKPAAAGGTTAAGGNPAGAGTTTGATSPAGAAATGGTGASAGAGATTGVSLASLQGNCSVVALSKVSAIQR